MSISHYLYQKKFTIDFLDKKMKVNEGEVPQYYIERSHQPITAPEEFNKVQAEFVRRKGLGHHYSGNSIFASRIVCGDCGSFYGSKIWLSSSKDTLLENCRVMQDHLTNCAAIDVELDELLREITVVTELTQRCIQENARSAQSYEVHRAQA